MGLSKVCRDLFNSARICIEAENIGEAKSQIEQAIALEPTNTDILVLAVGLLKYAELYSSARKVYENYREQTGLDLPPDYTPDHAYQEIVQREQDNLMIGDVPVFDLASGPIRFKRMSDLERGSLFSYVTTSTPVEEIEVSGQGITITKSRIKYTYTWNEITRASIVARTIFKGAGVSGADYSQKICTLEAPGKQFQFDVSSTCADFKAALLLRTLLAHYLDVEFIDERKPGFKAAKDDPIRNLKRGDRIRGGMIIGAIALFILYLYINQPR